MAVNDDFFFDDGVQRLDFLATLDAEFLEFQGSLGEDVFRNGVAQFIFENAPGFVGGLLGGGTQENVAKVISAALSKFSAGGNALPRNFNMFVEQLITNLDTPVAPDLEVVKEAIVRQFGIAVGIRDKTTGELLPNLGEWAPLANVSGGLDEETLFAQAFGEFVRTYPYGEQGQISDDIAPPSGDTSAFLNFTANLHKFFIHVARLQEDPVPGSLLSEGSGTNLISYERIYNGFFPDNPNGFQPRLVEFYQKKIEDDGFFLPSQAVDDWVDSLKSELLSGMEELLDAPFLTSVTGNNSEKVGILNRIIFLVSRLVETLQRVAATQARQLDILTNLQKNYTDMQSQIPVVSASTTGIGQQINEPPDDSDDDSELAKNDAERRQNINTNISQRAIETIRGRKQLEENKAKKIQSLVNQANDAVNQQAEIATALLQQLSSLLQALYR